MEMLENVDKWLTEKKEEVELIKKIANYINSNLKLISVLVSIFFTIGFLLIKSMGYAYELGKLYVNHIERRYIDVSQENFIFQLLYIFAILVVFGLINYLYYSVATCRKHRIRKLLILWIIEAVLFTILSIALSDIGIIDFIIEFWDSNIRDKGIIILEVILVCCMMNTMGIVCSIDYKRCKKDDNEIESKNEKADKIENDTDSSKQSVFSRFAISLIIIFATELIIASFCGIRYGYDKKNYKVLFVESTSGSPIVDEYLFGSDGKVGEVYPIVYENDEVYIMCKLCKKDGKIELDRSYQKIVEKNNLEIRYYSDIFDDDNWN